MKQRVTIQYSIYMEELEEEVRKLVAKGTGALKRATRLMETRVPSDSGQTFLEYSTLDDLNTIREELANADNILMDCATIVEGYLQYRSQGDTQLPSESDSELDPNALVSQLGDLQQQISQFRASAESSNENTP